MSRDLQAAPKPSALVGEIIAQARKAAGLNQTELAARVGRRQSWLSFIETGEQPCSVSSLVALARAIGIHPAILCVRYEQSLNRHQPAQDWFRQPPP